MVTNRAGAQCENCWVKHYRCFLVLLKEVVEAKVDCDKSNSGESNEGVGKEGLKDHHIG